MRFVDRVATSDRDEHTRVCAECAEWARIREAWTGVISSMRVVAPDELASRVAQDLEQPFSADSPAMKMVRSLPPLEAPQELTARVFPASAEQADLDEADSLFESPAVQAVRMLDRLSAPNVLDRLVEEEIEAPIAAQTERVVGNLERKPAPKTLESRVVQGLRRRIRSGSFARAAGLAAAAALLVWLGFFFEGAPTDPVEDTASAGDGIEREYSFRVVRADATTPIDPMMEALSQALTGGALLAHNDPPSEGGGG